MEGRWWEGGEKVVRRWWKGGGKVVGLKVVGRWGKGDGKVVGRWWEGGGKVMGRWGCPTLPIPQRNGLRTGKDF